MSQINRNRRAVIRTVGAGAAFGLAGCTGGGSSSSTPEPSGGTPEPSTGGNDNPPQTTRQPAPESRNVQIAASHYPKIFTELVTMVVAEVTAADYDLDFSSDDVTSFAGGGHTVRGIVTGGLNGGTVPLPALVNAYLAGAPLYLTAVPYPGPDLGLMAGGDTDIHTLEDLKGARYATTSPGGNGEAIIVLAAERTPGVSVDDIEIIYAGGLGEAITAVKEGAADVTFTVPTFHQRFVQNGPFRMLAWTREYAPEYAEYVLAMGGPFMDNNTDVARDLVHAYNDASEWIIGNPMETATLWSEVAGYPEKVTRAAIKMHEDHLDTIIGISPLEEPLKTTASVLQTLGTIDQDPPWSDIIRQELLPEDKQVDWIK